MAEKLLKADYDNWYRKLNVARTQQGVDLAPLQIPSVSIGAGTIAPINQLVADIKESRNNHHLLGLSDDSTAPFVRGSVIRGKSTIDDTIQSMLRVCPNTLCETQIITETMYVNGDYTNGDCAYGSRENGTHVNGSCGTCATWEMCAYNGGGFGGLQDAGWAGSAANWVGVWLTGDSDNWYGTKAYGSFTNGSYTQGADTNGGNSNTYYDPATATYSAKDFYSKEEADRR